MGIKHVHGSTTSLNGCKVDIDGDVEYSLIPMRITGFHGSVHLSGEKDVPNGDLYSELSQMVAHRFWNLVNERPQKRKAQQGSNTAIL